MRGLYDGPTTGRHSLFSRPAWARASKSLDLPRASGTAEAAADLGVGESKENNYQGSAHEQLRQATVTPAINIPGALKADGTPQRSKPLKPNVASFLRLISPPDCPPSQRPHIGRSSSDFSPPVSPVSTVGSGDLPLEAEQKILAGSPKTFEV